MATSTGGSPASAQPCASSQARPIAQRPTGTISPISSSSGTNSAGKTTPRSGWFQRSSASTPRICCDCISTCG